MSSTLNKLNEQNKIELSIADFSKAEDAQALVSLLDQYARDPMGGEEPLTAEVKANLPAALKALPHAFTVLCRVDGQPAGLVNCFEGFSTFSCKPIVNIHDVTVASEFRGLGLSKKMMNRVADIARDKGCVKVTLEVLEGNKVAQSAYRALGYTGYQLGEGMGEARFWQLYL